jgi:hypothetical protein
MDGTTATEPPSHEEVLEAMAEVMERQARVARAEAALGTARRRLQDAMGRLAGLSRARGEPVPALPAIRAVEVGAAPGLEPARSSPGADADEAPGTLRQRILDVMEASPSQVYTPALLAPVVGSRNRDSIRNTLLVLAGKGKIAKVGTGQYQAHGAVAPEVFTMGEPPKPQA